MTCLRIELFGGLRVTLGERSIFRFRTKRAGSLLAFLALHPDQGHAREMLAELLWPEGERDASLHNLRTALSSLRRQLEPPGTAPGTLLTAGLSTIRLNPQVLSTDVAEFEAALQAANTESVGARIVHLSEAVAKGRAELLAGNSEEWVEPLRRNLVEKRWQALRRLVTCLRQTEDWAGAVIYARELVEADPLDEAAQRELMDLYRRTGRHDMALEQFERLAKLLQEELGSSPDSETCQLAEALREERRRDLPALALTAERHEPPVGLPVVAARVTGTQTYLAVDAGPEPVAGAWRELVERAVATHGGHLLRSSEGYALAAFPLASEGLRGAALVAEPGPGGRLPGVRLALHTGEAAEAPAGASNAPDVPEQVIGRLLALAHPGQTLCSAETAALLRRRLPEGVELRPLGSYRLSVSGGAERLYQLDLPSAELREFPPLAAPVGEAGRLPLSLTRFIGRERELNELSLLATASDRRLLTLTGMGGVGKTRLALELAQRLDPQLGGAVWFVPLVDLANPDQIPDRLLDALRISRMPGAPPLEQVAHRLESTPSLLILDNLEHLVPRASRHLEALLNRAPTLRCLVTSRCPLEVAGEREYAVLPLPVPEEGKSLEALAASESVALLVDRAQAARPDFQVTLQSGPAIGRLCRALEGLPLALELTATWASVLSPAQMADRLAARLEVVRRPPSGVPRHASLRSILDWSYELLSPEARALLPKLSVFAGGWTLEAAEAVCEEPRAAGLLLELRRHSLVNTEETTDGMRFRMLETVRAFSAERLPGNALPDLERRHWQHFLRVAESGGKPENSASTSRYAVLEREEGNLRTALDAALRSAPQVAVDLCLTLSPFWLDTLRYREGARWLALAAELHSVPAIFRGKVLAKRGKLTFFAGELGVARGSLEEAARLSQDTSDNETHAESLAILAVTLLNLGEFAQADDLAERGLGWARQVGNPFAISWLALVLGTIRLCVRPDVSHLPLLDEALAIARGIGDAELVGNALSQLVGALVCLRHYDRAYLIADELGAHARLRGDLRGQCVYDFVLAELDVRVGKVASARLRWERLNRHSGFINGPWSAVQVLELGALMLLAEGNTRNTVRLCAAANSIRRTTGVAALPSTDDYRQQCEVAGRAVLGDVAYRRAWDEGSRLTWEEAVQLVADEAPKAG
jgi:predicted ATPase/DNA-binding SARP family transcriptional activator